MKPKTIELVYRCRTATEATTIDAVLTAMPQLRTMYAPQGTLTVRVDNSDSPYVSDDTAETPKE